MGDKVGGIAVHTGARVADAAGPGEVFVSSTVRDLVAGLRASSSRTAECTSSRAFRASGASTLYADA